MSFGRLGALKPGGKDKVVIGVLCAPIVGPKQGPCGEWCAEFRLTDLDKHGPRIASLVLVGRAMEHWAHVDGLGRPQCVVGSTLAVLNPGPAKRAGAMLASFETQVLKLGSCPSLRLCDAKGKDGLPCGAPYNEESGQSFCVLHSGLSHGARSHAATVAASATKRKQNCRVASVSFAAQQRQPPTSAPIFTTPEPSHPAGKRRLVDLVDQADRVIAGSGTSKRLAASLASASALSGEQVLGQLKEIEAANLDVYALRHGALYEEVGKLVCRDDVVGAAAKRLRRRWREMLHGET